THSGNSGTLILATDASVTGETILKIQAESNPRRKAKEEATIARETEFLRMVSRYMCKGGRVTFIECDVAQGPAGQALSDWTKSIWGPDVTVTLYGGSVRWSYWRPIKCKRKEG